MGRRSLLRSLRQVIEKSDQAQRFAWADCVESMQCNRPNESFGIQSMLISDRRSDQLFEIPKQMNRISGPKYASIEAFEQLNTFHRLSYGVSAPSRFVDRLPACERKSTTMRCCIPTVTKEFPFGSPILRIFAHGPRRDQQGAAGTSDQPRKRHSSVSAKLRCHKAGIDRNPIFPKTKSESCIRYEPPFDSTGENKTPQ
jgi:hypothetical protein